MCRKYTFLVLFETNLHYIWYYLGQIYIIFGAIGNKFVIYLVLFGTNLHNIWGKFDNIIFKNGARITPSNGVFGMNIVSTISIKAS